MEPGLVISQAGSNFRNRQPTADFIVAHHNRDQNRFVIQSGFKVGQGDLTGCINWQVSDPKPLGFQVLHRLEDRFMFNRGRDNVLAQMLAGQGGLNNRRIIAFRAPTSEDNLIIQSVNALRNHVPGVF